jgi:hypothetical protein
MRSGNSTKPAQVVTRLLLIPVSLTMLLIVWPEAWRTCVRLLRKSKVDHGRTSSDMISDHL